MTESSEKKVDKNLRVPEKLLICIGPSQDMEKVIRTVKEMADNFQSTLFAVYVEDPGMLGRPDKVRSQAIYNLRLAEGLGAETITLRGSSIAAEIIQFARQQKISTIIVGKPSRPRWQIIIWPSPVDELMRLSGNIDVLIVTGKGEDQKNPPILLHPQTLRRADYEKSLIYFIIATGVSFLMYPYFELSNLIMVYLVGVMITAIKCGRGPAILNSILSVLGFDFFFVPPRFTFEVEENHYILTFAVMFVVALMISHFTVLIRRQAEAAQLQERQTAAILALSQQLASARGLESILNVATKYFADIFQCEVAVLLPDETGRLHVAGGDGSAVFTKDIIKEINEAQEAYRTGLKSGWGTVKSTGSEIIHIPLQAAGATLGVISLRPADPSSEDWLFPEQMRLRMLESLTKQVALALEVERLQPTIEKEISQEFAESFGEQT